VRFSGRRAQNGAEGVSAVRPTDVMVNCVILGEIYLVGYLKARN
jgi:hypothetical protein